MKAKVLLLLMLVAWPLPPAFAMPQASPPITLTSTADFQKGNNEGLISTVGDRLARDRISAGDLATSWVPQPPIIPRQDHSSVAYDGYLYVIGGSPTLNEVLVAPIGANGSVGTWVRSDKPLLLGRTSHSSVVYNGYLYVMGGYNHYTYFSDVLVAPIGANGSMGAWVTSDNPLPSERYAHSSVVYNGFIYTVGGRIGGSYTSDVLIAPIRANGSTGGWVSSDRPLLLGRTSHSSVVYNGYLYVIAGAVVRDSFSFPNSDVLVASIGADGSIGRWTLSVNSLPEQRNDHSSIAHGGFIYNVGGLNAWKGTYHSDVLVAPISADGSIGGWLRSDEPLPLGRSNHSSVAHGGFIYTIGGAALVKSDVNRSIHSGDVLAAQIKTETAGANQTPDRLRGYYSHLIDLGSQAPGWSVRLNGQTSPGGRIRLQCRVASNDSPVFGVESSFENVILGSFYGFGDSTRWVWIRLTLDDTATTITSVQTAIDDITVEAGFIPTVPPSQTPTSEPPSLSSSPISPDVGGDSAAGGCGSVGLDGLVTIAIFGITRRRSRKK